MTLQLSPELESQIERAAQLRGMNAPSFAIEALRVAAQSATDEKNSKAREKEERKEILALLFASQPNGSSVDEFLRGRSAEGRREANK